MLVLWVPLRQRPGIGTVLNVLVIGVSVDASLALLPTPGPPGARAGFLAAGIVGNALSGALYVGAGLGTGPRDGLWVGLVRRTGYSVRVVRTAIEVSALAAGFALGGTVGAGTVLYALLIGPLVQLFLPFAGGRGSTVHPSPTASAHAPGEGQGRSTTNQVPTAGTAPSLR